MMKLLMEIAGAQLIADAGRRAKRGLLQVAWMIAAGLLALIGLVFLLVAVAIWLMPVFGPAGAIALVGGATIIIGLLIVLIVSVAAQTPRRRPLPAAGASVGDAAAGLAAGFGLGRRTRPTTSDAPPSETGGVPPAVTAAVVALVAGLIVGRRI
ncbi:hypothetical protein [Segnochrobactrum spirostomi]|uniref:Phage holin family protein n=1 Tax=Segnochrobactrum spirostomi TaxID=2608987 RepID=A0A6A7Y4G9_9HYPH|nr:hypothetical protein [Segnochrobactrum spirostomi]MQT13625.1 hypothetical protein [Segnochrobactrum spirostomi]